MTFSEELIKILEYLAGKVGVAVDWTSANMLPYAQELCEKIVTYEIWTSVFWIVFMWAVCIALWVPAVIVWIRGSKCDWDWSLGGEPEVGAICLIFLTIAWTGITIIVTGVQAYDIITAIYFPEKIIYEFITKAIQSAKGGY